MTKSEELKLEAWKLWLVSHNMDLKDSEAKLQDWSYGQVFSSAWDAAMKSVKAQIEYLWIEPEEKQNILATKIFNVEFDMRSFNCLRADGIETLGDLIKYSERDLMRVPNMGRKSAKRIQEVLATRNLKLKGPPQTFKPRKPPVVEGSLDEKDRQKNNLTAYANECRKRRMAIYRQWNNGAMSMADLARDHGVTPGRIHQIIKRVERERRTLNDQIPSIEHATKIAKQLPVPPWLQKESVDESNHG